MMTIPASLLVVVVVLIDQSFKTPADLLAVRAVCFVLATIGIVSAVIVDTARWLSDPRHADPGVTATKNSRLD